MPKRRVSRMALALLERVVPDGEPLAGDLVEEFTCGRSALWVWFQVLAAIWAASLARPVEIRPLRLVDLQPAEALERSRRLRLRFRPVNLSASPVPGVGGLGLVIFAGLATLIVPAIWWLLLGTAFAGVVLGVISIAWRERTLCG